MACRACGNSLQRASCGNQRDRSESGFRGTSAFRTPSKSGDGRRPDPPARGAPRGLCTCSPAWCRNGPPRPACDAARAWTGRLRTGSSRCATRRDCSCRELHGTDGIARCSCAGSGAPYRAARARVPKPRFGACGHSRSALPLVLEFENPDIASATAETPRLNAVAVTATDGKRSCTVRLSCG